MKKIFLFVPIILLIFLISIKRNNKNDIINEFQTIPFYKQTLQKEYELYKKKTNLDTKQVVLEVNIGLHNNYYEKTKLTKNLYTNYILVNKYNYLDKNYIPNNLVYLDKYAKAGIRLNKEAYDAFIKMADDAQKKNLNLRIISAYRSFTYQENLYNSYLKNDSRKIVDTYSARPGYSEHQTGLCIDIDNEKTDYNHFYLTNEYHWIINNAHKYGYILRYPKDKERITGYQFEAWHYRYVGNVIAKYIYEHNITFEEYYYEFLDK